MLLSQDGGRRQHSYLFAVHDRFERGADSHFGLAKTDVTADETVHWLGTFHVDLRVDDRFHLVRRFAERERVFKFRLPFCVRGESVSRMRFALCLDCQHFPGVIKNGCHRSYFAPRPSPIAVRAERRRFFSCANVAVNQIRLLEWNVELRFICTPENHYFLSLPLLMQGTR